MTHQISKRKTTSGHSTAVERPPTRPSKIIQFPEKGGNAQLHPIEIRLKELGRTKKWLAEVCGCSAHTISAICNGRSIILPNHYLTGRLKSNLGISLNYLILGPDCIYG